MAETSRRRPPGSTALILVLATGAALPLACTQLIGADKKRKLGDDEDAGTTVADKPIPTPTVTSTEPPPCPPNEKRCDGACVPKNDPIYGCSETGCDRCSVPYAATLRCTDGKCAAATCQPGRQDCNGKAEDGCEADLNDAKTCGDCLKACGPATPNCNPLGQCVLDCAPFTLCGTSCVDLTKNATHCGSCNKACPPLGPNSVPTCTASACTVTCNEGYADCDSNPATDCVQKKPYYLDADGDGFAAPTAVSAGEACAAPAGHSLLRTDCNDTNANVKPGQTQYFAVGYTKAGGGISYDYDCNGVENAAPGTVPGTCTPCNGGHLPAPARPGAQNVYCGSTSAAACGSSSDSASSTSASASGSGSSCNTVGIGAYTCK